MGTSKSYQAPTSPQWSQLKGEITRLSRNGAVPAHVAGDVLRDYIQTNGGSHSIASGGGAVGGSRAAQRVGKRLAGFAQSVSASGFQEALRDFGLGELVGKSMSEIMFALIDKLCDDGSTLDEVDARMAVSDLVTQILEDTSTFEEVEKRFETKLQDTMLGSLLISFYGAYLYYQFCRLFFERLSTKHGDGKASGFLGSIREFIISNLNYETFGKDLTKVDWSGRDGEILAQEIFQKTLSVFGD